MNEQKTVQQDTTKRQTNQKPDGWNNNNNLKHLTYYIHSFEIYKCQPIRIYSKKCKENGW